MQNNCYGLDCADTTTESASDETCARVPRGGGVTPYNGLCGEAPTERGTFFLFQVYERIGLLLVLFFADRFFSGCSFANSNSIRNAGTRLSEFLTTSKCCVAKQITDYNVSYLFFKTDTLVTYKLTLPFDLNGF